MVKRGKTYCSSNTVGLLKSYKHEKITYELRLIKQVTNRELGLYTSIASARKTELNIE